MRATFVFMLLIAAACAMPKHHNAAPAKHVKHVSDEELEELDTKLSRADEGDLEESYHAEDEDEEPALEEEEAEPALEEEEQYEEPQLEEAEDKVESENELEEDAEYDADEQRLEEEEEEEKRSKVLSDIRSLEAQVHDKETLKNLHSMAKDVVELAHASEARATDLKAAIKDRLAALKLQMAEPVPAPATHSFEEKQEAKRVGRVEKDVIAVTRALEADQSLSPSILKEARDNLHHITLDAEELKHASAARATDLKAAMKLRASALKELLQTPSTPQLEESGEEEEEVAPVAVAHDSHQDADQKVIGDIEALKSAVSAAHMSSKAKKMAKANLFHMLKDAEEIASTENENRRHNLVKSLKLRSQALRLQLEEN